MKSILLDYYTDKIEGCMTKLDRLNDVNSNISIMDDDLIEIQRQRIRSEMDKYSFYMRTLKAVSENDDWFKNTTTDHGKRISQDGMYKLIKDRKKETIEEIKSLMTRYLINVDDLK